MTGDWEETVRVFKLLRRCVEAGEMRFQGSMTPAVLRWCLDLSLLREEPGQFTINAEIVRAINFSLRQIGGTMGTSVVAALTDFGVLDSRGKNRARLILRDSE